MLNNTFRMDESFTGAIMAADNVLALFLLPFFGGISDRWKGKLGRRMLFILFGTLLAALLMNILPILDNSFYREPGRIKATAFVAVMLFAVREPELVEENLAVEKKHPEWDLAEDDGSGGEVLPAPVKKSMLFLLLSIAF